MSATVETEYVDPQSWVSISALVTHEPPLVGFPIWQKTVWPTATSPGSQLKARVEVGRARRAESEMRAEVNFIVAEAGLLLG
jgi:hypothetical protein